MNENSSGPLFDNNGLRLIPKKKLAENHEVSHLQDKLQIATIRVPFKAVVGSWEYHAKIIPTVIRVGFITQEGQWESNGWVINPHKDFYYKNMWWGAAAVHIEGAVVFGVNEDPSGGAEGNALIAFFSVDKDALAAFLETAGFSNTKLITDSSITRTW